MGVFTEGVQSISSGFATYAKVSFHSLKKLLDKKSSDAAGSEILLDIKAQFEIVEGHYSEAQATIAALRQLPDDAGRSHRCEAWLFYKRGDANTAIRILTQIVKNSSRREVESRYYRAIIAVDANRPEIFQEDYEYILNHGRYKKDDMLRRLRMRKALTEGDWRSAEQEIEGVDNKNFSDMGLYRKNVGAEGARREYRFYGSTNR